MPSASASWLRQTPRCWSAGTRRPSSPRPSPRCSAIRAERRQRRVRARRSRESEKSGLIFERRPRRPDLPDQAQLPGSFLHLARLTVSFLKRYRSSPYVRRMVAPVIPVAPFDPVTYAHAPSITVSTGITLAGALVDSCPKDAPANVKKAATYLKSIAELARTDLAARNRELGTFPDEDSRVLDNEADRCWGGFRLCLQGKSMLRPDLYPKAKLAAELDAKLFAQGTEFLKAEYASQSSSMGALLQMIDAGWSRRRRASRADFGAAAGEIGLDRGARSPSRSPISPPSRRATLLETAQVRVEPLVNLPGGRLCGRRPAARPAGIWGYLVAGRYPHLAGGGPGGRGPGWRPSGRSPLG